MKYPTKVITALLKEGAVLVVGWGDCWCRGESSLPHKTLGVIKEAEDEDGKIHSKNGLLVLNGCSMEVLS